MSAHRTDPPAAPPVRFSTRGRRFAAAIVACAIGAASAGADSGRTLDLTYTTGGGQVRSATLSWPNHTAPQVRTRDLVATVPDADGLAFGPDGALFVGATHGRVYRVAPGSAGGAPAISVAASVSWPLPTVGKVALDPSGQSLWAAGAASPLGPVGAMSRVTLSPSLAPGAAYQIAGVDTVVAQLAWAGDSVFYVGGACGSLPGGTLGVMNLGSMTTTCLRADLGLMRSVINDPYTGNLVLFGDGRIVQVTADPGAPALVSSLDLAAAAPGARLVSGASDGRGLLIAAADDGRVIMLDISNTRLVGDAATEIGIIAMEPAGVRSLAPLSGSGSQRPGGCVWDNGQFDGRSGQLSQTSLWYGDTRTADDFALPAGEVCRVTSVKAALLSNTLTPKARLEIYDDCDGRPGALLGTFASTQVASTGDTVAGLMVFDAVFSTGNLWLPGGRTYWLSVLGVSNPTTNDEWYWATAGNGAIRGVPGAFRDPQRGYPEWTGVDRLACGCTDFSFTVQAECCKVLWDTGLPRPLEEPGTLGLVSMADGSTTDVRAADIFIAPPCRDLRICFLQAVVYSNCSPLRGVFELYDNACALPTGAPIRTAPFARVQDLGYTVQIEGRALKASIVQAQDLDWPLTPGQNYWLAPVGARSGSLSARTYAALARSCDPGRCQSRVVGAAIKPGVPSAAWESAAPLAGGTRNLAIVVGVSDSPKPVAEEALPVGCKPDFNGDFTISVQDIYDFLSAWFAGCP